MSKTEMVSVMVKYKLLSVCEELFFLYYIKNKINDN